MTSFCTLTLTLSQRAYHYPERLFKDADKTMKAAITVIADKTMKAAITVIFDPFSFTASGFVIAYEGNKHIVAHLHTNVAPYSIKQRERA